MVNSVMNVMSTLFNLKGVVKKEVLDYEDDLDFTQFVKAHEQAIKDEEEKQK